jgi:hypothetical protein
MARGVVADAIQRRGEKQCLNEDVNMMILDTLGGVLGQKDWGTT